MLVSIDLSESLLAEIDAIANENRNQPAGLTAEDRKVIDQIHHTMGAELASKWMREMDEYRKLNHPRNRSAVIRRCIQEILHERKPDMFPKLAAPIAPTPPMPKFKTVQPMKITRKT